MSEVVQQKHHLTGAWASVDSIVLERNRLHASDCPSGRNRYDGATGIFNQISAVRATGALYTLATTLTAYLAYLCPKICSSTVAVAAIAPVARRPRI